MLRIRLRRMGSNRRPLYRVVVSDSRKPPTSTVLEEVGYYNPRTQPSEVRLDRDRIDHWVSRGAQLSDTVKSLLRRAR